MGRLGLQHVDFARTRFSLTVIYIDGNENVEKWTDLRIIQEIKRQILVID